MPTPPTLEDFQRLLLRHAGESLDQLGRETAAITARAAQRGALSNNRVVFSYTDALEEHWRTFASAVMDELGIWNRQTKLDGSELRNAAEAALRSTLPKLVESSRVHRARSQFVNQAMLQSAVDRIKALEDDIEFRLRQFDIGMDGTRSDGPPS